FQALAGLGIDAHGRGGALGDVDDVQLLVFLEAVQIRNVLEQVGVERALRQCQVGLEVVVELDQLDLVALCFELRHDRELQHVVVVAGGGAKHEVLLSGIGSLDGRATQCDGGGEGAQNDTATDVQHVEIPCREEFSNQQ